MEFGKKYSNSHQIYETCLSLEFEMIIDHTIF